MTTILAPGMIGLTQISGDVGKGIEVGQFLNGEGFARWEHAFVVLPDGQILEAEPGGAVIVPMHYADENVYWCEGIYGLLPQRNGRLVFPAMTSDIMIAALALKGVKYSFLDYAALSAHRLHIPAPGLQDYIASTGHMICSQLADEFYLRLGAHVFDDGRWPGYVTPASLYRRDLQLR